MSQEHTIVTPEAVVLDIDTAGLGSRLAAAMLDGLIQSAGSVLLVIALVTVGRDSAWTVIAIVSLLAFVPVIYGALFEGLWNGRTPGKKAVRLRVVQVNGHPVTWRHVAVRNLFRLIDAWVGAIVVIVTPRSQRLGDLAAGTVVVREPRGRAPQPLALVPEPLRDGLAQRIDTSGIGPREYGMLRDFLRRRFELNDAGRLSVGRQLADMVRARVPLSAGEPIPDELLIEAAVVSVQARESGAGEGRSPAGA